MSIEVIMTFSSAIVTFILGLVSKNKIEIDSKFIPIQNVLIGILAGLMVFACGLCDNIFVAVLSCFAGSMGAGGFYDALKTKVKDDDEDE